MTAVATMPLVSEARKKTVRRSMAPSRPGTKSARMRPAASMTPKAAQGTTPSATQRAAVLARGTEVDVEGLDGRGTDKVGHLPR